MRCIIFLLVLSFCFMTSVLGNSEVDNRCNYEKSPIKVKITSVKQTESSRSPKYKIRFEVLETQKLPSKVENRVSCCGFHKLLENIAFLGPHFFNKNDIPQDKIFDSDFNLLIRGNAYKVSLRFKTHNLMII